MNVQVLVLEIQRDVQPFALNCREQSRVDVEIDRVAEFVTFARSGSFNACREINGVVPACRALPKTAEQVSQRFVTEKVETFLSYFKANVSR